MDRFFINSLLDFSARKTDQEHLLTHLTLTDRRENSRSSAYTDLTDLPSPISQYQELIYDGSTNQVR